MDREFEQVPRSIRVLAAISAGILAAVLVIPAFVGIVWGPENGVRESRVEWDDGENNMDKADEELEAGEDAGGKKSG